MTKNFKLIGILALALVGTALIGCGSKADEGSAETLGGKAVSEETKGRLQIAEDTAGGGANAGTNDTQTAETPPPGN